MSSPSLARLSPRAAARTAAVQYGFGAVQSLLGLWWWPEKDPRLVPVLTVTAVVCAVGAGVHGVLGGRLPWWMPYVGGACGTAMLLVMCARTWGDQLSALLVAQVVLLMLTVSVFYGRRLVGALVAAAVVGWGVVCGANAPPGQAVASWLSVGPPMIVAAVVAQWLVAQLLALVERDALTGLANRASWNRQVAELGDAPAAILLMDLDHFKAVNDGRGHAAGDDLLCAVAAAWAGDMRRGDTLARLGGDEFAVLLPHAGADEGWATGERLRAAVADLTSVTVGVTERAPGEAFAAAMLRADAALYRAKHAGRGRVHLGA